MTILKPVLIKRDVDEKDYKKMFYDCLEMLEVASKNVEPGECKAKIDFILNYMKREDS